MDKDALKKIVSEMVKQELEKQRKDRLYGIKNSSYHTHNGIDSPRLDIEAGTPGGSDTSVQYNDGGSFGGDSNLTWDKTNQILSVDTIQANGAGNDINVLAADAVAANTNGGSTYIESGDGNGSGQSGNIVLLVGTAGATGVGGGVYLTASHGGATSGAGGPIAITAGNGLGGNSNGGSVVFTPGVKSGSGVDGDFVTSANITSSSRNGGFLFIPTSAGAPSGTPSTYGGNVALVYDTTNNKLMVYDGGWIGVTLS